MLSSTHLLQFQLLVRRMCNKKSNTLAVTPKSRSVFKFSFPSSTPTTTSTGSSDRKRTSSSFVSSFASLTSLQDLLPDRLIIYPFQEIRIATNNFRSNPFSSSSSRSSWRCTIRGKDAMIFQREFCGDPADLAERLSSVSRSNHSSLIRLLGASLGGSGDCVYLVYEYVRGANLADCLRNSRNPNYTALPSWLSRMQVAVDVAQGLEYVHHQSGIGNRRRRHVHNRIKSSSVIVTDPDLRAKICHFGATEITGEIEEVQEETKQSSNRVIQIKNEHNRQGKTSKPRRKKIQGSRGYMASEIVDGATPSQKTDVFAFGVMLLELLSGEEPISHRFDRDKVEKVSLIETAQDVIRSEEGDDCDEEERRKRLRRWVDWRLRDSFPVDVAEMVLALALECVATEAERRPCLEKVAGKLSKCLLHSIDWADQFKVPVDFTVSMAPR